MALPLFRPRSRDLCVCFYNIRNVSEWPDILKVQRNAEYLNPRGGHQAGSVSEGG